MNILSLDRPVEHNASTPQSLYEIVEDERNEFPLDKIENNELKLQLVRAIQNLPEKLRLAITLYYFEKLTFKEIGQILSVSESRISQIHSETIKRLKNQLSEMVSA